MKYLIYLRVSTDKQDTETQLRLCLEYMKAKHVNNEYSYEIFDEGNLSSGVKMYKRPELMRMLENIKKSCTVLVYELDRLARDVLEQVTIYRIITREKHATVHSLNDPYCDEMSVTIMGAIAQKQRERIRAKTKDKLKTKKQNGQRYSRFLPYGYGLHETKLVPIRVGNDIVMKRGVLVPIYEEQKVLKEIYRLSGMGMSFGMIAQILEESGYKNREGKPFQKMSIYRILSRREQTMSSDQLQEGKELQMSH